METISYVEFERGLMFLLCIVIGFPSVLFFIAWVRMVIMNPFQWLLLFLFVGLLVVIDPSLLYTERYNPF